MADTEHGETRDQLKTIIDSIPILAWTTHPDGSLDFFNRACLDYTGLSEQQSRGWGWAGAIHPDDRERVLNRWRNALASGASYESEARLRRFDGEHRWFLIRANAQRDAAGNILKWYGSNTEIEDRKRAEHAQTVSDKNFRLMVDCVPGLVSITNAAGAVEFVNHQVLEFFGRSLEELQAWEGSDAVHPDDLERVIAVWREGMPAELPYEFEHRLRRHDGVYRWFKYRNVPLRDADGRLTRWYGLMIDIDDLKRAEQESRSTERDLRLVIDNVPGLVFTARPAGEVEFVNRRLLDYFGKTLEELQAWKQADSVHPEDLPNTIALWTRAIELGQQVELDQRLRRHDGVYCWFHFRAAPRFDADGRLIRWYGLLTDINDLKRADDALRITQGRLSRAAHLATISELSASIAHEINQPLAAIVSNGHACRSWLSAEPPNIERALLSAERIIRDGNSSAEVIQRMRSLFSHAPPLEELLNLNEVVEEVCSLIAEDLRATGVTLKADLSDVLPWVSADRVQIQQVIANLTRNGIEAMESVTGRPKELRICTSCGADEVTVGVEDHGQGISDPQAVFEPFYTTKTNGMGMGLAICRSIIEAHGGRIWVTNNVPQGARFTFALRFAPERAL
jgi:hypothetical protein